MGKNKRKYRFETGANTKYFRLILIPLIVIGIFAICEIRKAPEQIGLFIGFCFFLVFEIAIFLGTRECGYTELNEEGVCQRNRIGHDYQKYRWEEVKEVGYGTAHARGTYVQYIYIAPRKLTGAERNAIIQVDDAIRVVPSEKLKKALDTYWKKEVIAPEGWENGGSIRHGLRPFGIPSKQSASPFGVPTKHRLRTRDAKFPKEVRIQVRLTDKMEKKVGEPVENIGIALVVNYERTYIYRVSGVTNEQGWVVFTREQIAEKIGLDGEETNMDKMKNEMILTLWDARKENPRGLATNQFRITEEDQEMFARTDNLRYDERYDYAFYVDKRDQDEEGILTALMPVYPHDEEKGQCL